MLHMNRSHSVWGRIYERMNDGANFMRQGFPEAAHFAFGAASGMMIWATDEYSLDAIQRMKELREALIKACEVKK